MDPMRSMWKEEESVYFVEDQEQQPIQRYDFETDSKRSTSAWKLSISRRARKMMLFIVLLLALTYGAWTWYFQPWFGEEWEFKEGFMTQEDGTYEIAKVGHFDGVKVQNIDGKLLPGGVDDPDGKRRLVFVGDIHGCAKELKKLLKHVEFNERKDHLIAVGDVISKGPDNVGVMDELIRLNASSVRGNHEDKLLALAPSVLENAMPMPNAEISTAVSDKDRALLRSLSERHLKYLYDMPLILRIPPLPLASKSSDKTKSPIAEEILVVHAGLVPTVPLEKQDPYFAMNMRAMRTKSHLPLKDAADTKGRSRPWHDIWGWYNDRLFRKKSLKGFEIWDSLEDEDEETWFSTLGLANLKKWPKPQVVVYGHHAKAGLQITRWSKGLDTACVRGGELTAMVLDARGDYEIVSVSCKEYL